MAIAVYIPTPYRDLTNGQGHVHAEGATIGELIADLERSYPGLGARLGNGQNVHHHVNVFVNGQEMRGLSGEATGLAAGDEVAFIPALVGGGVISRIQRLFPALPKPGARNQRNDMIEMTDSQRNRLIDYSLATRPEECCGFLYGRGTRVERVIWIENVEHSALNFRVRPQVVLDVQNRMDDAGLDWIGIFHSHTHSAAVPSPTDIFYARGWPNTYHVIVSVADEHAPSVRAWTIDDDIPAEQVIKVSDVAFGHDPVAQTSGLRFGGQEVVAR